jgi:hypothetical protein
MLNSPFFLRRMLMADAAISGLTAALMILAAAPLAALLALPQALLHWAGLVLIPYVALVTWVASRAEGNATVVRFVVICNFAWAHASIAVLMTGWISPNVFGYGYVIVQAVAVAALGELQWLALRRQAKLA